MSVAVLVPNEWDPAVLARWGAHFAIAQDCDLVLLLLTSRSEDLSERTSLFPNDESQKERVVKLNAALENRFEWSRRCDSDAESSDSNDSNSQGESDSIPSQLNQCHIQLLPQSDPVADAVAAMKDFDVDLLVVPRHQEENVKSEAFAQRREIMTRSNCATLLLCPGQHDGRKIKKILVPTSAAPQGRALLECASSLGGRDDRELTAVYVQAPVDVVAQTVGERALEEALQKNWKKQRDRVKRKVVLNANPADGIRQAFEDEQYDLMLLGASYDSLLHRVWVSDIAEQLLRAKSVPPTAIVRRPIPLASRLRRGLEKSLHDGVPQLERKQRVDLVQRVQSSSVWDFDFIALMSLSTLIAGCGLLLNSGAVVIGAMLVAPLMTPLLGAGLSLVQGNSVLLRNTMKSVAGGFCLAFMIGLILGCFYRLFISNPIPTTEMLGRGAPGFLDLVVALVSGVAAAYATSRPNLLGALPGVAIAAALVPPIATSGLAASMGEFGLGARAALLFFTNIVAIVLGTACALWAVGIRSYHEHGPWANWNRWITALLMIVTSFLVVYFVMPHHKVPHRLEIRFRKEIEKLDAELVEVDYSTKENTVRVVVRGPDAPNPELAKDLAEMAKNYYRDKPKVQVETRLFLESQ